jgi:glycosyltransferase involved in cell wall biosynthesis
MNTTSLPSLLYIGDVPVEPSIAGAALLYRLLQDYPPERLQIVQSKSLSSSHKSLPNVHYEILNIPLNRLLLTRFSQQYSAYLLLTAKSRTSKVNQIIKNFKPEAILTVAGGFSWLTAAAIAKRFDLPLHLIVHDDYLKTVNAPLWMQLWLEKEFANVYKQAKVRFCVSPYMAKCYEKLYNLPASVLYPSRAVDAPVFHLPRVFHKTNSLTFAYAGSINSPGYAQQLASLADVLKALDCSLLIYSPLDAAAIKSVGLNKSNVITRSLIPSNKLIQTLRNEADVLFVPMVFEEEYRLNMQISFPSKLTDYTACGLPLLIFGPEYCSAIQWERQNPGVAEVVDYNSEDALMTAVKKLVQNPEYRTQLAECALKKGQEYFSYQTIVQGFYDLIKQIN